MGRQQDTLTSHIGHHFELGENKPYLTIRLHKSNLFNSLFLLDNHSSEQKSGIPIVQRINQIHNKLSERRGRYCVVIHVNIGISGALAYNSYRWHAI